MADNVTLPGTDEVVATDQIGSDHYQLMKLVDGTADSTTRLKVVAEDAAHSSGDTGLVAMAVRKDTAAALAGTDADYTPLISDSSGRLHVNVGASELPSGAATSAKQDTLAGLVATAANQTTIIGHVDGIETALASQATAAKQDTLIGHVDGIESALANQATAAHQVTQNGYLDGIEGLLTAIDGRVDGVEAALAGPLITKDAGINATTSLGVTSAVVTSADATTPVAVTGAPTSGQRIQVWDVIVSTDTEMWVELECETTAVILFKVYMAANSTIQITPRGACVLASADKKLMIDTESAGNVAVTCIYSSIA